MPNTKEVHAEQFITSTECDALRLLSLAGWSDTRLMMTFGYTSKDGIERHKYNMCCHDNKIFSVGTRYSKEKKQTIKQLKLRYLINHNAIMNSLECNAYKLLYLAGWKLEDLQMVFETTTNTVKSHIKNDCTHDDLIEINWQDRKGRIGEYEPISELKLE